MKRYESSNVQWANACWRVMNNQSRIACIAKDQTKASYGQGVVEWEDGATEVVSTLDWRLATVNDQDKINVLVYLFMSQLLSKSKTKQNKRVRQIMTSLEGLEEGPFKLELIKLLETGKCSACPITDEEFEKALSLITR